MGGEEFFRTRNLVAADAKNAYYRFDEVVTDYYLTFDRRSFGQLDVEPLPEREPEPDRRRSSLMLVQADGEGDVRDGSPSRTRW